MFIAKFKLHHCLTCLFFITTSALAEPRLPENDLQTVRVLKKGSYTIRTDHLDVDGTPKYTNQLIREDSPYLLQHAHNPVNWFAWGDEAFHRAKQENKPVFLSIGYSTCHWCHVMEVESFDNEAIAKILNDHFISIKVDREQRPDLDEIYMTAVQMFTGRGGWPMSSFLTPEGKPFFGGTYFPPQEFSRLLNQAHLAWVEKEAAVRMTADEVSAQIELYQSQVRAASSLSFDTLQRTANKAIERWDKHYGGFGGAPKFPNETYLLFLLDYLKRSTEPSNKKGSSTQNDVRQILIHTLYQMARGGIYDQIGGGFHRYSTDRRWLVPHFEKMLYNQALLARIYGEAYVLTGDEYFALICKETLDYVLRDMSSGSGGFYSASDADSEGEEGRFFLWTTAEIRQLLPDADAEWIIDLFGMTEKGNFAGRNILFLPKRLDEYASEQNISVRRFHDKLTVLKRAMYEYRESRVHPLRDDKIITAWNGMMITSLVTGYQVLHDSRYLKAALYAADFLWDTHYRHAQDKTLVRISLNGATSINGVQEDYAYFLEALIALYDASTNPIWLDRATIIAHTMLDKFIDPQDGLFLMSATNNSGPLITRMKDTTDSAIPSGNSVALLGLIRLWRRTGDAKVKAAYKKALATFSGNLNDQGLAYTYMMLAVSDHLEGEVGATLYFAEGKVKAQLKVKKKGPTGIEFSIPIGIAPNWHINNNKPNDQDLIATQIINRNDKGWSIESINFPLATEEVVAFSPTPLLLYQGNLEVTGSSRARSSKPGPFQLGLVLQACNDELCLVPETQVLMVRP